MVPYKSDFTKNNYDLFIKGPAFYYLEMILSALPSSAFSLDLFRTSGPWRTIFLWMKPPEFLWVIKFSCIELSSSLIFISLVFFLILTFLISDESGQTPTRQKSSSLSGQFKSFKKFNKCKSWEIIFNKLILFGRYKHAINRALRTGMDERIKSKDSCWMMGRWIMVHGLMNHGPFRPAGHRCL